MAKESSDTTEATNARREWQIRANYWIHDGKQEDLVMEIMNM
jgi:hypothetical protein